MTTQKAQHTPTPWKVNGKGGYLIYVGGDLTARRKFVAQAYDPEAQDKLTNVAKANAEFIVRACNAHDDLLAACKVALFWCPECGRFGKREIGVPCERCTPLRAAVAKAEGGKVT